jgi:hypothetical protein
LLGVQAILNVNVASKRSYPLRGIVTVSPSSSLPTPAPLQSLVGCGLAAGIVPVHVTLAVWPALLGTVTPCVAGVAAPPCSAPSATATTSAPKAAIAPRTATRLRVLWIRRISPPTSSKVTTTLELPTGGKKTHVN